MTNRRIEVDILRCLATIGMIIYHILFILNFYQIHPINLDSPALTILARFVQITFITLTGVSLSLSAKGRSFKKFQTRKIKSALLVLLNAALISLVTYALIPNYFVKFGILHLIGLSILIIHPLVKHPLTSTALAIVILTLTPLANNFTLPFFNTPSIDYFPIIPWVAPALFGITIGHFLRNQKPLIKNHTLLTTLCTTASKHSLMIYMIHIPIIICILYLFGILDLDILSHK